MPVLIPLSINISFYIDYLIREFKSLKDKRETFPVYFNFGLIGAIGILFPFVGYWFLKDHLIGLWRPFIVSAVALFTIGFFIFRHLKKKNITPVFYLTFGLFAMLLFTALPLKKAFVNDTYNPLTHLKHNSGLNLYQFNYIAPEMIWQYGDKIPPIKLEDGSIVFPEEDEFGLLAIGISPEDAETLQSLYTIREVDVFDLNEASIGSKQYKDRLKATYYVLAKR